MTKYQTELFNLLREYFEVSEQPATEDTKRRKEELAEQIEKLLHRDL